MLALLSLIGLTFTGIGLFMDDSDENEAGELQDADLAEQPVNIGPLPSIIETESDTSSASDNGDTTGTPPSTPTSGNPVDDEGSQSTENDALPNEYNLSAERDIEFAGDGDQIIHAGNGDDYVHGEAGNDEIHGENGADELHGGLGNDKMFGGDGDDQVFGHVGNDQMSGGKGNDQMHGGDGNDVIVGGDGDDAIVGSWGNDVLDGEAGEDTLFGGGGDDTLTGVEKGEAARDYLNGGAGDDIIIGGDKDVISGGEGADQIFISSNNEPVRIDDYEPELDQIQIIYTGDEIPTLSKLTTDDGTTILANGRPVAELSGATEVNLGQIGLISDSSFQNPTN